MLERLPSTAASLSIPHLRLLLRVPAHLCALAFDHLFESFAKPLRVLQQAGD
jgi:hypothetical protein